MKKTKSREITSSSRKISELLHPINRIIDRIFTQRSQTNRQRMKKQRSKSGKIPSSQKVKNIQTSTQTDLSNSLFESKQKTYKKKIIELLTINTDLRYQNENLMRRKVQPLEKENEMLRKQKADFREQKGKIEQRINKQKMQSHRTVNSYYQFTDKYWKTHDKLRLRCQQAFLKAIQTSKMNHRLEIQLRQLKKQKEKVQLQNAALKNRIAEAQAKQKRKRVQNNKESSQMSKENFVSIKQEK